MQNTGILITILLMYVGAVSRLRLIFFVRRSVTGIAMSAASRYLLADHLMGIDVGNVSNYRPQAAENVVRRERIVRGLAANRSKC
jgi:hypothetical protein